MNLYCNYSVKGCKEEVLKGLKYTKEDDYYNISNGIGIKDEPFNDILEKFYNEKLMVFFARPYDSFFCLGISDKESNNLDEIIELTPYDASNEELFITEVYPTDSFTNKVIDNNTGMMLKVDYENPFKAWWDENKLLNKSFNKKAIIAKQGYYNYSTNTVFGTEMKLPKSKEKISDKELLEMLKKNKISLNDVNDSMKDDVSIVEIAVKNNPNELKYASDTIKNNKDFIIKMVKYHIKNNTVIEAGKVVNNISKELKNDNEFFTSLIKIDNYFYRFAGSKLKDDLMFIIQENGETFAGTKLKNKIETDREYALEAVKKGYSYWELPEKYKSDRDFALEAVKNNGGTYGVLAKEFQEDKEIALIALKKCKEVVKYSIPKNLKSDPDIKKYLK